MKKFLIAFVIMAVLVPAAAFAETSKVVSEQAEIDALLQKINLLYGEIYKLGGKVETSVSTDGKIIAEPAKADSGKGEVPMRRSKDKTPRVMYWWGKVNQHFNLQTGYWETDPDGVSGADLDMLKYCQKWYPKTKSVKEHKLETIKSWKNRGNLLNFESRKMSYECSEKVGSKPVTTTTTNTANTNPVNTTPWVSPVEVEDQDNGGDVDKDMQIMYWWGKVNRHLDDKEWVSDPDGTSGASIDKLAYCKKWYPHSIGVRQNTLVTASGWHDAGNVNEYTSIKMSYYCLQD